MEERNSSCHLLTLFTPELEGVNNAVEMTKSLQEDTIAAHWDPLQAKHMLDGKSFPHFLH